MNMQASKEAMVLDLPEIAITARYESLGRVLEAQCWPFVRAVYALKYLTIFPAQTQPSLKQNTPCPPPPTAPTKKTPDNISFLNNQGRQWKALLDSEQNVTALEVPRILYQHTHLHFFLSAEQQPPYAFSSALLVSFVFPESLKTARNQCTDGTEPDSQKCPDLSQSGAVVFSRQQEGLVYMEGEDTLGSLFSNGNPHATRTLLKQPLESPRVPAQRLSHTAMYKHTHFPKCF